MTLIDLNITPILGTFIVGETVSVLLTTSTIRAFDPVKNVLTVDEPLFGTFNNGDILVGLQSGATASVVLVNQQGILNLTSIFGDPANITSQGITDFFANLPIAITLNGAESVPTLASTRSVTDTNTLAYTPPADQRTNPFNPNGNKVPANSTSRSVIPIANEPPVNEFKGKYPYVKSNLTEGGHLLEIDDTPGEERLLNQHVSGTYNEMKPDGNHVTKVVKDNYTIVAGDDYVSVEGRCTVYISGDAGIRIGGSITLTADEGINFVTKKAFRVKAESINFETTTGDFTSKSGNNHTFTSAQDTNIKAKKNLIASDEVTSVSAKEQVIVDSKKFSAHATTDIVLAADKETYISSGVDSNFTANGAIYLSSDDDTNIKAGGSIINSADTMEVDATLNVKNTTNMKAGATDVVGYGATQAGSAASAQYELPFPPALSKGSGINYAANPKDIHMLTDDDEEASAAAIKQGLDNGTLKAEDLVPPASKRADSNGPAAAVKAGTLTSSVGDVGNAPPDNLQLSKSFTLGKLSKHSPVCAHSVVAQHSLSVSDIVGNLQILAQNCLEPLHAQYPDMLVTNAFRVAGNPNSIPGKVSQHEKGQAADIQFASANRDRGKYFEIAQWCKDNLPFDQLILEYQKRGNPWIHVSFDPQKRNNQRRQILTKFAGSGYKPGLYDLS
jgi:hypothetical protein